MMTEDRKQELLEIIKQMQVVSSIFYSGVIHCKNHAFIEFNGFMNEYIKICAYNLAQGIDFTKCNIHSGNQLYIQSYQKEYIREKLECIFSGAITLSQNEKQLDADGVSDLEER